MRLFLGRDPACTDKPWQEWHLQAYVIQESRRAGYIVAGDMNAGKRNPGQAAATGILAGAPDLSFYLEGPRLVLIEMKTEEGRLSIVQKDLHARLSHLGFEVYTVFSNCPMGAWTSVKEKLERQT